MDHLSKIKPTEGSGAGTLDDVNMTLTMAFLYSIDAGAIYKGKSISREKNNFFFVKLKFMLFSRKK